MNRRTLILFGGAIIVVVIVIVITLFLGGRTDQGQPNTGTTDPYGNYVPPPGTQGGSQTIGFITVGAPIAGWKTVENSEADIAVKLPAAWDVNADTSNYNIKASSSATRDSGVTFDVYTYGNLQGLGLLAWLKSERDVSQSKPITVGSVTGVRYEDKLVYGGGDFPYGSEEIEDSFIVHLVFSKDTSIVEVRCAASGTGYETYESTCEEILNTFKFTD